MAQDLFQIIDPQFRRYVLPNAPVQLLGSGFSWTEGPVWFADMDCLLFSDIPNNRILRWTESGGMSTFRQPAAYANGNTRDQQGRLITCSHQQRAVLRTEWNGDITVIASHYNGKPLNSPNDVVVKSDGTVWFSDPHYGINTDYEGGKSLSKLPATLYRFDPRDNTLSPVAEDFDGPNGLCFSPDESKLYVAETGEHFAEYPVQHIRLFEVSDAAGKGPHLKAGKVFHTISPGAADGIRCDEHGNVWSSAGDGVHCISANGQLLGKILVPETVSNLSFGGRNSCRLFICASSGLYAVYTNVRGVQRP